MVSCQSYEQYIGTNIQVKQLNFRFAQMEDDIFHLDSPDLAANTKLQNQIYPLQMAMTKSEMRRTAFAPSLLELLGDAVRQKLIAAINLCSSISNQKYTIHINIRRQHAYRLENPKLFLPVQKINFERYKFGVLVQMQNWYNDVSGHDVRVFAAFRFALAFFHVFHTACCCGLVHETGTNAILQVINTITQVQRMRSL